MNNAKTLIDKIWDQHVIRQLSDGRTLLHIDRHLIHDGTSRQAFDGMRARNRRIRNLDLNLAVIDHIVSTLPGRTGESHPPGRERIHALRDNSRQFGLELYDVDSPRQGIVHVIAPELGIALPGCTLVCGDSHTATNGGLGALAWGIGTTEVMHVMAAQALLLRKPKQMRITFHGTLGPGVFAKDLILYFIGKHGVAAGIGFAVEYAGPGISALSIEERMTICNMSIEFGARMGIVAPDDKTIDYVAARPFAPTGALWERAVASWRTLASDAGARFEREFEIDCGQVRPQVTWGSRRRTWWRSTSRSPIRPRPRRPNGGRPWRGPCPTWTSCPGARWKAFRSTMPSSAPAPTAGCPTWKPRRRSCAAARCIAGVTALVVPGSMQVKAAAEAAGLDKIFLEAGFEWRNAGCSMCVGSNGDLVPPGKRAISTTNRNFEHRQGPQSRTHLASPAMVAAAAVSGCITDVRKLMR